MLRLEPGNKAASAERMKLIERIKEEKIGPQVKEKPFKDFEKNLKGAIKQTDFETLKRDFQTMKELTTKMKTTEEKIADKEKKAKVVAPEDENRIEPIQKQNHLRSQKPMTRINIVDVESKDDAIEMDTAEKTDKPKKIVEAMDTDEETMNKKTPTVEEVTKSKGFCRRMEKEISSDLSKVELVDSFPEVPRAFTRFLHDWRKLKTLVNRSTYQRNLY